MDMPGRAGGGGGTGGAVEIREWCGNKSIVDALPVRAERRIEENRGEQEAETGENRGLKGRAPRTITR